MLGVVSFVVGLIDDLMLGVVDMIFSNVVSEFCLAVLYSVVYVDRMEVVRVKKLDLILIGYFVVRLFNGLCDFNDDVDVVR